MSIGISRLVYVLIAVALAVGLLTSYLVRSKPTLAASASCYGLCSSSTSISPSKAQFSYGSEQIEKFDVKVAGTQGSGVPAGRVVVEAGSSTLCTIHLYHGAGHCSLSATELRPGRHYALAHYDGNASFDPSNSKRVSFYVLRHSSGTMLTLSTTTVTYGHERAEVFHVRVRANARGIGVPTGWVVVRAGARALCWIHLHRGAGQCRPGARALGAGRHFVVAHYRGNWEFRPSASTRSLLIVRP